MYSAEVIAAEAVATAYQLATKDKTRVVALLLHGFIKHAFKETRTLSWPLTHGELGINSVNPSKISYKSFLQ